MTNKGMRVEGKARRLSNLRVSTFLSIPQLLLIVGKEVCDLSVVLQTIPSSRTCSASAISGHLVTKQSSFLSGKGKEISLLFVVWLMAGDSSYCHSIHSGRETAHNLLVDEELQLMAKVRMSFHSLLQALDIWPLEQISFWQGNKHPLAALLLEPGWPSP